MPTIARRAPILAVLLSLSAGLFSTPSRGEEAAAAPPAPRIQMAILLDTSNSMDGLINQARSQLWKIVNQFATATRHGRQPRLEVALFEYGKSSLPASEGHIQLIVPLTEDLDKVSEELFRLQTNGCDEYCGQVIARAAEQLAWSTAAGDLKCIFIAGNEPFTQGSVAFQDACRAAIAKDITVSTIFCGPHQEGIETMWAEGAKLADGSYMSIDQDRAVPEVPTPHDAELARLSAELNKTYAAYGTDQQRETALLRQAAQDANAATAAPAAAAQRAATKASRLYSNAGWDLVDACQQGRLKLEDLKDDQLPEDLRKMSLQERREYIDKMAQQRKELQQQIAELSQQRDQYVAAELKKQNAQPGDSLDAAIVDTVRTQGENKQYTFK